MRPRVLALGKRPYGTRSARRRRFNAAQGVGPGKAVPAWATRSSASAASMRPRVLALGKIRAICRRGKAPGCKADRVVGPEKARRSAGRPNASEVLHCGPGCWPWESTCRWQQGALHDRFNAAQGVGPGKGVQVNVLDAGYVLQCGPGCWPWER